MIKNQKGVSLLEMVVALPLAVMVLAGLSVAILNFIINYQEVKLYTQLQEDLFNAIETIRYGYTYENVTEDEGLIGLATARNASIGITDNSLLIKPVIIDQSFGSNSHWSRFRIDGNGHMNVYSRYGVLHFEEAKQVFPSTKTKMFGNEPQFKILNPNTAWQIIKRDGSGNAVLVKIELEAQVRFRERQPDQSFDEDKEKNLRKIKYETSIFVGNSQNQGT